MLKGLNSYLFGLYIVFFQERALIGMYPSNITSEMTERILKSSISVMEAFSQVRNNQSYAHDNQVLNYNESLLIFGHVTSSIRFIERLENIRTKDEELDEEIPF